MGVVSNNNSNKCNIQRNFESESKVLSVLLKFYNFNKYSIENVITTHHKLKGIFKVFVTMQHLFKKKISFVSDAGSVVLLFTFNTLYCHINILIMVLSNFFFHICVQPSSFTLCRIKMVMLTKMKVWRKLMLVILDTEMYVFYRVDVE